MAGKRPPPTYLSVALGALVAELERLNPGLAAAARARLKSEADLSIVYGLHGEHESEEDRVNHHQAIRYLGSLHRINKANGRRRKLKQRRA
jgi:hypothetical protein